MTGRIGGEGGRRTGLLGGYTDNQITETHGRTAVSLIIQALKPDGNARNERMNKSWICKLYDNQVLNNVIMTGTTLHGNPGANSWPP
jgi:hypothetical protein